MMQNDERAAIFTKVGSGRGAFRQRVARMFLTTLFCLSGTPHAAHAVEIGQTIPMRDARMENVDGRSVTLGDTTRERGLLVIFTCNTCPWARAWEDRIVALGNTYGARGVGVIAINSNDSRRVAADGIEEMQRRARARGYAFPYVVDATSAVARAFGASKTPETFLFNAQGVLVYRGAIDDNAEDARKVRHHYLRDALEALIGGKTIPVAETKALGCSIKLRPEV